MAVVATSGAKLFIGDGSTTWADRATDTYTQIKEVTSLGELGGGFNFNSYQRLEDAEPVFYPTFRQRNEFTFEVVEDLSDAGQSAFSSASDTPNTEYNFKVEFDDNPDPGGTGSPTTWYIRGVSGGFSTTPGDVNSIVRATGRIGTRETPEKLPAST